MRKRILALLLTTVTAAGLLTGCGGGSSDSSSSASDEIAVVSREDGSGTRGAFIELFGIEEKDDSGEKVDKTVSSAMITNSTSVMMTTVGENEAAIGYISLGSLNDTVRLLRSMERNQVLTL
jgi:phosphate transport system substrate-binding protein